MRHNVYLQSVKTVYVKNEMCPFFLPIAAALLTMGAAAAGCISPMEAPLATIDTITPQIVEPGDVIRIGGTGFIEGKAQITLEGDFRKEGQKQTEMRSITLQGTAVSDKSIESAITSKSISHIAGEHTRFAGKLRITFPSAHGSSGIQIVAHKNDVLFDFRPAGTSIPQAVSRARDARRFLKALGITLHAAEWGGGESLVVLDIDKGSLADRAGLTFGDRLLAVNGVALASLEDLSNFATSSTCRLDIVTKTGTLRQAVLRTGLKAHLTGDELAAIVLASVALGLFLAFSAPTRRRFPPIDFGGRDPFFRALYVSGISLMLLIFPAAVILFRPGYLGFLVLLAGNAFGIAAYFWSRPGKIWRRVLSCLVHFAPTPIMLSLAFAIGSSTSVGEIVAGQQSSPWGINAWSSPFAVASLILAMTLAWPRETRSFQRVAVHSAVGWITVVPCACMLVVCWLGGWWFPGISTEAMRQSATGMSLGCLVFLCKSWIVLLAIRWFASKGMLERRSRAEPARLEWRLVVLMGFAGASLWWFWTPLPKDIRIAGQLLATGASVSLVTAAVAFAVRASASQAKLGHDLIGDNRRNETGDIPA